MKNEIFDWYADKHLEAHKQIELGAIFGLSESQIISAMEHCYNKIVVEGKKIPDDQIAWYVRNVAKDIDTSALRNEHELIEKAKSAIAECDEKIKAVSDELLSTQNEIIRLKEEHIEEINDLHKSLSTKEDHIKMMVALNFKKNSDLKNNFRKNEESLKKHHKARIESMQSAIKRLEEELSLNNKKKEHLLNKLDSLEKNIENLKSENSKLVAENQEQLDLNIKLNQKLGDQTKDIQEILAEKERRDEQKQSLKEEISAIKQECNKVLEKQSSKIAALKASKEALIISSEGKIFEAKERSKLVDLKMDDLWEQLKSERKKAKRIATFYYIFIILSLIQAGLWLL